MNMTFQDILDEFRGEINCPGILMGVKAKGIEWYGSAGSLLADDLEKPFYIYSVTKAFTATCILRLVEDGLIGLDDPLIDYMPSPRIPKEVTVRLLLNHRSGIPDYCSIPEYKEALLNDSLTPLSRNTLINKTQAKGLSSTPGTGYLYSNTGYIYLYKLIEILTESSFADAIHRFIIEPLKLDKTSVATEIDTELVLLPGFANESPFDGKDMRQLYHPDWVATGLVISTIKDVMSFYEGLFAGELLSQESLKEMTTSVRFNSSSGPGYGLGIGCSPDYSLGESYGHGGNGPGYVIYAGYMPNLNGAPASFCAICNSTPNEVPGIICHKVMERIGND